MDADNLLKKLVELNAMSEEIQPINRRKPLVLLAALAGAAGAGCAATRASAVLSPATLGTAAGPVTERAANTAGGALASTTSPVPQSTASAAAQTLPRICAVPDSMTAAEMAALFPDPSKKPPQRDWLEFVERMWQVANFGPFETPKEWFEALGVVVEGELTFEKVGAEVGRKYSPAWVW